MRNGDGKADEECTVKDAAAVIGSCRARAIAIDANLFMRHGVRRFLCVTQESAGSWVVVPAEAMRETCRRYHVQAGRFAKRLVEREIAQRFGPTPAARIKAQGEAGARELTRRRRPPDEASGLFCRAPAESPRLRTGRASRTCGGGWAMIAKVPETTRTVGE